MSRKKENPRRENAKSIYFQPALLARLMQMLEEYNAVQRKKLSPHELTFSTFVTEALAEWVERKEKKGPAALGDCPDTRVPKT